MTHQDLTHPAPPAEASGRHHEQRHHEVAVTIDGHRKEITAGNYLVSALKTKLGVPVDYELDEVVNGEFRALADTAHIEINGGEHFISHVRRGGSS